MFIIDSSAFLAFLNEESGKEIIEPLISSSIMSSLAVAEVTAKLAALSIPENQIHRILMLIKEVRHFDKQAAVQAGLLAAKAPNLTLADLASLTLAKLLNLPLYTANQNLVQVQDIEVIYIK